MEVNDDRPYLIALSLVEGLGPVRFKLLLDFFGRGEVIWRVKRDNLEETGLPKAVINSLFERRENVDPVKYFNSLGTKNIKVLTILDESYPENLKNTADKPVVLYYKGDIRSEDELALAVVGSRKMSSYGRQVTEELVTGLVDAGLTIVSGLARGVDSCAHRTALKMGGRTIAVLGSGVNMIYPPENEQLAREIIESGGAVVSEFPPEMAAFPGNFPARNRIISGLSQGVLVTEAAQNSGSLITANSAANQGREVFAVPGPITSPLSAGPSELIKLGAKLVYNVNDILEELHLEARIKNQELRKILPESKEEEVLLGLLENETKHIDELVRESKLGITVVSSILTMMEMKGKVRNLRNGEYARG